MTGRENIFLNGSILGMQRREIAKAFDQIVSFAGVEKFIDTPVKRYSSGMYVRLAFSVTSFLRSEIMIVDEVLSVGDQQFQNKCIGRLQELIGEGRTVLFVSHGSGLVRKLCSRAILLKEGRLIYDGEPNAAFDYYQDSLKSKEPEPDLEPEEAPAGTDAVATVNTAEAETPAKPLPTGEIVFPPDNQPGNDVVRLISCKAMDANGVATRKFRTCDEIHFQIRFRVLKEGHCVRPGAIVYDELGNSLFWSIDTATDLVTTPRAIGEYAATVIIPKDFLAPGVILIGAGIGEISGLAHAYTSDAVAVNVSDDFSETSVRGGYKGPLCGFVRPRLSWRTELA